MSRQNADRRPQIAKRIRAAREMAGLSQGQVAKLLGLHRPSISEIEGGNRRVSADELSRLAKLFDVSMSWLVAETAERLETDDPNLQLAARELSKLKPEDLDRLMKLLAAMRENNSSSEES